MKFHIPFQSLLAAILLFSSMISAQEAFSPQLRELEKSFGGRFGFMAKNLRSGEVISWREHEKFPSASLIKLPILTAFYHQVAAGKLDTLQEVVVEASNRVAGSGVLQHFSPKPVIRLADAALLMIILSDNSATNLVIDALGATHTDRLNSVNEYMRSLGLQNTRLWNKVMAWDTKTDSSESIRYGLGVSTPADMVLLLEKLYRGELADSLLCRKMIDILAAQEYKDAIPRLLPKTVRGMRVAHKTGGVTGVRTDAGLVLSAPLDMAVAAFCDQAVIPEAAEGDQAKWAIATAARLAWDHFNQSTYLETEEATQADWNPYPGGAWSRVFVSHAPFPHVSREAGWHYGDNYFPRDPHYGDSSIVIIVPSQCRAAVEGIDLIVHFHGWNNDNLGVLEKFRLPQQLAASRKNAILVLAQGPWRASDSGGGKMEEPGGFRRFVEEIVEVLRREGRLGASGIGKIIVSAHSGGYRPAICAVSRGGLADRISAVFLFDAFYAMTEELMPWLQMDKKHRLRSVYTDHLADEHAAFVTLLKQNDIGYSEMLQPEERVVLEPTTECHNCVVFNRFQRWLEAEARP